MPLDPVIAAYCDMLWGRQEGYARIAFFSPRAIPNWCDDKPYPAWPQERTRIISGLATVSESRDCYVGVLLHSKPDSGTKDTALAGRLAWAEVDHRFTAAQAELVHNLGAAVVNSGQEDHHHLYVLLDRAVAVDELEGINRQLVRLFDTDAKFDGSVVLRPAGTWWRKGQWNGKAPEHAGKPPAPVTFVTRLTGKGWAPEELTAVLSAPIEVAGLLTRHEGAGWVTQGRVDGEVDKSACFHAVVTTGLEQGMTVEGLETCLLPTKIAERYVKDGRLKGEIERIAGKHRVKVATSLVGVDGFPYTEVGNADRLIAYHGERLRYVHRWQRWIVYQPPCWVDDYGSVRTQGIAKAIARQLWQSMSAINDPDERKRLIIWAFKSESAATISNSVKLARDLTLIEHDELDANSDLFACQNYIYNTVTGELLPHRADRLIMKVSGARYDAAATAPKFDKFLNEILPDPEVRAYVQRWAGYCLTGSCAEQVMNVWHGPGQNGKSTLIHILEAVLGPYAVTASSQLLIAQKYEPHPTIKMALFRKRLATVIENNPDQRLNEALTKQLTGGDTISGHYMRENDWEFSSSHKFIMACNTKPIIEAMDYAMWRRIHLVPFDVKIADDDKIQDLDKVLVAEELSGILRWCIEGCRLWRVQGLDAPQVVVAATEGYKAESDTVALFMSAAGIVFDAGSEIASPVLQELHTAWCEDVGFNVKAHWHKVYKKLEERGAMATRGNRGRFWVGLKHNADFTSAQP